MQYQLTAGWPSSDRLPTSTTTFLNLVELVNQPLYDEASSGAIILQCRCVAHYDSILDFTILFVGIARGLV